ncbi:MAG: RecX family transcriptional regulator, partial [candidate division NC10 bacterium]|nr:RecX family transcriptional regulator [candidate division NC10 bacterium]
MRRRSSSGREAALHVAFRLLTIRARSQQELARHLHRRGFAPAVVAGVLEDLRSRRLLDDRAFAAERARTAVLVRRVGARRLRAELRASGV